MNRKGFTLIDFIIYIGLITVLLTISGSIALNVIYAKAKLRSIEEVSQNGRFVMEKISTSIREADAINNLTQGSVDSTLSLQVSDNSLDPTVFNLVGNTIMVTEGNNASVGITSDEVNVTNLQFTNLSYDDSPGTIRIEVTIEYNNVGGIYEYDFEDTFYTTVNLRKK